MPTVALACLIALPFAAPLAQGVAPQAAVQRTPGPIAAFSRMTAGGSAAPWEPLSISDRKRPTSYELVDDAGTVVLHAAADNAASVLAIATDIDVQATPIATWRWKIAELIADADPRLASTEDAPARLVLEFDGDKSKLPLLERGVYGLSKALSGRELPYATLIYVWANRDPVGTVIPNPRTRRVQMVVAASGARGVGAWQSLTRDVRADFLRAFGEEPGRLTAVGVFTDTDNTGGHAEAWYGDIRFGPAKR
ncbi:MAG TPA: DUF3047 domain-containing protein [Casimicrobiaceae bacterium]|nr:DUF3047 domain-containing protein [Casimicrobiaceae bacterium]